MKKYLLLTYCLFFTLSYSIAQNQTNLRTVNSGGRVARDAANNDWQFSIGGTFVAPIGVDTLFITQGFNQPDVFNDIELLVYVDKIANTNQITNQQPSPIVIGIDTSSNINRDFEFVNKGAFGSLVIDSIKFVNEHFSVFKDTLTIIKKGNELVTLSLTETAIGKYSDTVYIYSNSIVNTPFIFPIFGEITEKPEPEIIVFLNDTAGNSLTNSSLLTFGSINKNDDSTQTITILNNGIGDLAIDSITIDSPNFSLVTINLDSLAPNELYSFLITLNGNTAGKFTGSVTIYSNDLINNIFNINLSGEVINSTTWTNGSWTNGLPDSGTTVILTEDYNIDLNGSFNARKLIINENVNLIIENNELTITDSIINNGAIAMWCLNPTDFNTKLFGNSIDTVKATIVTDDLLEGTYEESFYALFEVDKFSSPIWTISGYPLNLKQTNNRISGTPVQEGEFEVIVSAQQNNCFASDTFYLDISSLPDPDLEVRSNFTLTCSDRVLQLQPTYISQGKISYSRNDTNSCLRLSTTGELELICNEVSTPIDIEISIAKTDNYRGSKTKTTIYFERETPEFKALQTTFDLFSGVTTIPYYTNSSTTPEFSLLGNSSTKIILESSGRITPLDVVEDLPILVKISKSDCHTSYYDTLEITITKIPLPPIANTDSINFYLYQTDLEINLYQNDYGVTAQLDSSKLDLDLNNEGFDKFIDIPGVGLFTESKDVYGTILFRPDPTFIGSETVYYSISDEDGLIGYGEIIVSVLVEDEIPNLEYRELYTPNGDGFNDIFIIGYLNYDNPGDLTIIDRLGNELFYQENYENDWDFTDEKGNMVDDGAYFFVYIEEGRDKLQGTFEIKRR